MRISVSTSGVGTVVAELRKAMDAQEQKGARALRTEHEIIMTRAKLLCPVAVPGVSVPRSYRGTPGTLRGSGHVQPTERAGGGFVSRGGFGGPAAPYAVYVHEDLEAHHAVGQAKFYETAMLEAQPGLTDRLAEAMRADRG